MKIINKIFLLLAITAIIILAPYSFAETLNVQAQSMDDFTAANHKNTIKMKLLKDTQTPNGEILQRGAILEGKLIDIEFAKRGRRDGYLVVQITKYITPLNMEISVDNPNAIAKVKRLKEIDLQDTALSTGATVAGFFVKNISYPINFTRGVISPYKGKNRLESGVQKAYEKSMLTYISAGDDINLSKGDNILLQFRYKK